MSSLDAVWENASDADRACLQAVIELVRTERPDAVVGVGYGMPALMVDGKPLIAVALTAKHLSLYPFSGSIVEAVADDLTGFSSSKGTIRFTAEKPLPAELVRRIVRLRASQIENKQ